MHNIHMYAVAVDSIDTETVAACEDSSHSVLHSSSYFCPRVCGQFNVWANVNGIQYLRPYHIVWGNGIQHLSYYIA